MKITYIGHSGFLIELSECYLLFDYYEGSLPERDTQKPMFLFCSHFHPDHFNPEVFEKIKDMDIVYGVFDKGIFKGRTPEIMERWFVKHSQIYELPMGIKVETFKSTDTGVAFLVTADEKVIYHGGDLNDWFWEGETEENNHLMTEKYRKEIDKLAGREIHVAFIPLDPRQEAAYAKGMVYFLEATKAEKIVPMHFWNQTEVIERFLGEYPQFKDRVLAFKRQMESREIKDRRY